MSIVLLHSKDLKSNMDRFIEMKQEWNRNGSGNLKSNMDRFIAVCDKAVREHYKKFKIQYG